MRGNECYTMINNTTRLKSDFQSSDKFTKDTGNSVNESEHKIHEAGPMRGKARMNDSRLVLVSLLIG